MTRKTIFLLLIFVVIAGAIAGAFVFLNQLSSSGPGAMPSFTNGTGGTAIQQSVLPCGGVPKALFTVPSYDGNYSA